MGQELTARMHHRNLRQETSQERLKFTGMVHRLHRSAILNLNGKTIGNMRSSLW